PFTVARQAGAFVDAGVIGSNAGTQTCITAAGTNTLQISAPTNTTRRAAFSGPTGTVGSIDYARDHPSPGGSFNLGGAAFSGCVAGVVLDAGAPALDFLQVETHVQSLSHPFSLTVANAPGGLPVALVPSLYTSPDGSLLLLVN